MRRGRVIGLDKDAQFLDHARAHAPANVEFRHGDAYDPACRATSFDLVHMRFVASTAGDPERLLREAIRLCRPGGIVALQEPDCDTLNCYPPHPAWDETEKRSRGSIQQLSAAMCISGQRLYGMVRQMGLVDVHYRPVLIGVRSIDPMVDYLPATVESLRGTITRLGLLSDDEFPSVLAEARRHLQKPDTVFTLYTVAQVWGRKPRQGGRSFRAVSTISFMRCAISMRRAKPTRGSASRSARATSTRGARTTASCSFPACSSSC